MVVKSLVFQQAKDENSPFRPQTTTHYNYNDFGRIRLKLVCIWTTCGRVVKRTPRSL